MLVFTVVTSFSDTDLVFTNGNKFLLIFPLIMYLKDIALLKFYLESISILLGKGH